MKPRPLLSVVIAAYRSRSTIEACLSSLAGQTYAELEVILVESSGDGTESLVSSRFPRVRLLRPEGRKFPGDARNLGIASARGELIALLDADCQVAPDWAERVVAAHERPEPVIATAIAPDPAYDRVAWAAWFCKCVRWAPEIPAGPMPDLPACSLSFKRPVFEECGPFLAGTYCSDTAFCWAVRRRGHRLWFEPSIQVRHWYSPTLREFLARQRWHGQVFAEIRRVHTPMPRWRSRLLGLAWPLLAPLLFSRLVGQVLAHRVQVRHFLASGPLVFAGLLAWSAGEGQGYRQQTQEA